MPPKGRVPNPPPRRRPRVAGLHQPARPTPTDPAAGSATDPAADLAVAPTADPMPGPAVDPAAAPATDPRPDPAPVATSATREPDAATEAATAAATEAIEPAEPEPAEPAEPEPAEGAAVAVASRPRRAATEPERRTGPDAADELVHGAEPAAVGGVGGRRLSGALLVVVLLLVTVVGGAAAIFFRGQAARASTGSADNLAVVDTAATGEVVGQVSKAIETVLSYDYTKLEENEAAGREVITGRYADEFDTTFADVRKTAPEQKLVLNTTVLLAGVTVLGADRAEVIATMDLAAVRDTTPYNSPGRVKVVAAKVDGRWKIAEMTLL